MRHDHLINTNQPQHSYSDHLEETHPGVSPRGVVEFDPTLGTTAFKSLHLREVKSPKFLALKTNGAPIPKTHQVRENQGNSSQRQHAHHHSYQDQAKKQSRTHFILKWLCAYL